MNIIKKSASAFILLFLSLSLLGQDLRFSQFQLTPLHLNPASTGELDGKVRILSSYRNQWSDILRDDSQKAFTISADSRKEYDNRFLGFGLSAHRDVAGELRFIRQQGNLSLSVGKLIRRDSVIRHSLALGGQFGIAQRKLDPSNVRWEPNPDPQSPCLKGFSPDFLHIDLSMGLLWSSSYEGGKSFFIGAAWHHLNEPNISFLDPPTNGVRLNRKIVIHAGGELPLLGLAIVPAFMYQKQGPHMEMVLGSRLKYSKRNTSRFYSIGLFYRMGGTTFESNNPEALVVTGNLEIGKWILGVAYDYTVSKLKQVGSADGAYEITLGYIFKE